MTSRNGTQTPTPQQAARQLWNMGANVTSIPAGGKEPAHEWNSKKAPWATERQDLDIVNSLPWNTQRKVWRGRIDPPIETVGVISGPGGWRALDIDPRKDEQENKIPVPVGVVQVVLSALGLPDDYPWQGPSRSGAGWHVWFRCDGELPPELAAATNSKESGVKIGVPLPDYVSTFDHIELRWDRCQTVLPAPSGYNGHLPSEPPARVDIDQARAAFLAIATPKKPDEKPRPRQQQHTAHRTNGTQDREQKYIEAAVRGKVADAIERVRLAPDGDKHYTLRDMARLCGGVLHYGVFTEDELSNLLYDAIAPRASDTRQAQKTIDDGLKDGQANKLAIDIPPGSYGAPRPAPRAPQVDQAGSETQRPRFTLETLDDLAASPPTQWLIPERIPADSLTLLYGPSESGKSFIALHWALTIALRNPDRAVIYVAPEGGSGYARRAQAWLQHWKKDAPPNLRFIRAAPRLGDSSDLRELIDTITPYQPIFVALDTLARCAVELDENSAKDMGLFIEACDTIRRATGAAVMPVHHSGKDARNGARGSSALRAAVDMAHEVARDGELVTLACDKSKDIAKPDAIYLHMMEVADSVVLMPSDKVITTRDSKLQKNERAALEALALEVFENAGASARKLVEIAQVPEGSLYRVLSKLLKRGYVTQASKGDPYYISDTGRRAITNYQESINSGASWGPDDDPPDGPPRGGGGGKPPRNLMQEAMNAGDSGDSSGDSFNCELSLEYGSTKPNYHSITGYDGAEVIEPPESDSIAASDYHQDTAPESPTITSITDYHPTIDSDTPSLSSSRLSIYDSRESESATEREGAGSMPAQASGAAAPPTADLPDGWRLVRCDYQGNISRFAAWGWRAAHTSGEMTEPTPYPDTAARAAWAAYRKES